MTNIITTLIESPFKASQWGTQAEHVEYARMAMLNSILRGEAPFASHLLYTQVLNDTVPEERRVGIEAGLALGNKLDITAVYIDYGVSTGMIQGVKAAIERGRPVHVRSLKLMVRKIRNTPAWEDVFKTNGIDPDRVINSVKTEAYGNPYARSGPELYT